MFHTNNNNGNNMTAPPAAPAPYIPHSLMTAYNDDLEIDEHFWLSDEHQHNHHHHQVPVDVKQCSTVTNNNQQGGGGGGGGGGSEWFVDYNTSDPFTNNSNTSSPCWNHVMGTPPTPALAVEFANPSLLCAMKQDRMLATMYRCLSPPSSPTTTIMAACPENENAGGGTPTTTTTTTTTSFTTATTITAAPPRHPAATTPQPDEYDDIDCTMLVDAILTCPMPPMRSSYKEQTPHYFGISGQATTTTTTYDSLKMVNATTTTPSSCDVVVNSLAAADVHHTSAGKISRKKKNNAAGTAVEEKKLYKTRDGSGVVKAKGTTTSSRRSNRKKNARKENGSKKTLLLPPPHHAAAVPTGGGGTTSLSSSFAGSQMATTDGGSSSARNSLRRAKRLEICEKFHASTTTDAPKGQLLEERRATVRAFLALYPSMKVFIPDGTGVASMSDALCTAFLKSVGQSVEGIGKAWCERGLSRYEVLRRFLQHCVSMVKPEATITINDVANLVKQKALKLNQPKMIAGRLVTTRRGPFEVCAREACTLTKNLGYDVRQFANANGMVTRANIVKARMVTIVKAVNVAAAA